MLSLCFGQMDDASAAVRASGSLHVCMLARLERVLPSLFCFSLRVGRKRQMLCVPRFFISGINEPHFILFFLLRIGVAFPKLVALFLF
jgi:hypothetical protein